MEEDYKSRSNGYGGDMQIQSYYGPPPQMGNNSKNQDSKFKKGKSTSGGSSSSSSSSSKNWSLSDPEFQRKKRVASYKVYAVEGRMKGSFRKSFRWLKDKYSQVVYGFW